MHGKGSLQTFEGLTKPSYEILNAFVGCEKLMFFWTVYLSICGNVSHYLAATGVCKGVVRPEFSCRPNPSGSSVLDFSRFDDHQIELQCEAFWIFVSKVLIELD
jgi:hypothetical protein